MKGKDVSRREFVRDSAAVAAGVAAAGSANASLFGRKKPQFKSKPLNYNEEMEYRRLGKTNLMVSAVCMGGHWKRVNVGQKLHGQSFEENRRQVVDRCIEVGINYIDACCRSEVVAYSKALEGRRDQMYLALSYCGHETRNPNYRTAKKLMESLDELLLESKQEYTDIWRITCFEPGGKHTHNTACEIVEALTKAKEQGKARFIGLSTHDRRWIKFMIEYFPELEVICTPYTANSKALPSDSVFEAIQKCDVGVFGIKPFASNSLFAGSDMTSDQLHTERTDRLARIAIRYILCNPAITAPIPGLIDTHQVDNVAKAIKERRELDLAEATELEQASKKMWASLPRHYQWLKDWEYA